MIKVSDSLVCRGSTMLFSLLTWQFCQYRVEANPTGGTVTQGSAFISPPGSVLTITQTTPYANINWQSFNIGAGETTTFVQPSSSSVVWNQIGGSSASQIMGNLNANGYVILQNANGFSIGGQAAITAHGLVLTTASTPALNLSSGGAWEFDAPPPKANIVNYGQINITGGGSVFLIGNDIVNSAAEGNGTISAPGGTIGLYAGEKVLVSTSPNGLGLSAQVTLPKGSVNNTGQLIADGGSILAQAQTVNQGGLIQANTVQTVNGTIELVASDSLTLGAKSDIEANGDASTGSASQGGMVVLDAGSSGTYSDTSSSVINVTGQNGGVSGIVDIIGNGSVNATIGSTLATLENPYDLTLSFNATGQSSIKPNDWNLSLSDLNNYSSIDIHTLDNIELQPLAGASSDYVWLLNPSANSAFLSLQAGNDIILDNYLGISAPDNWSINLRAGTSWVPGSVPVSGNDGIYLDGDSYLQTENGNINLWAANEVQINTGDSGVVGNNGIRTLGGGSIDVTAQYGDVNAGGNPQGFTYQAAAPYYLVSQTPGGISTAAGGNVNINAGGNIYSYVPSGTDTEDGGSGAFGSQPGNVTLTAGGSIYGHYVLANGVGTMTAGQNIGSPNSNPFALSLIDGTWNVNAPNGNIYLQEVRNPNGVFNNKGSGTSPGYYLFNYGSESAVDLNAGVGVYLTDNAVPRTSDDVPIIYPPTLDITAGSGGVVLDGTVILFPSPYGNVNITTTDGGNLESSSSSSAAVLPELYMSDSSRTQWTGPGNFGDTDHGTGLPVEYYNPNPVVFNIAGSIINLILYTTKETQMTVGGDMLNASFSGENLHSSDVSFIHVGGQIFYSSAYSFVYLPSSSSYPTLAADVLPPGAADTWDEIFNLVVDPATLAAVQIPANTPASQIAGYIPQDAYLLTNPFPGELGRNPGFIYNPATGQLGFGGAMPSSVLSALTGPLTVLVYGANGVPLVDSTGHFETTTINWVNPLLVTTLYNDSQGAPSPFTSQPGLRLGGPGLFDVNAGSISLGNSFGILTVGVSDPDGFSGRYDGLAPITPSGATLDVTAAGNLDMLTSTIASLGGGDVNVTSTGGSMDLGSGTLFFSSRFVSFGIFASGDNANVNVKAFGDVNIDGSRIATYNGGNIFIESQYGNVNAGTGGDTFTGVSVSFVDPGTETATAYNELVFGSGIVANTLVDSLAVPGAATVPGNIIVETPHGSIYASLGGIVQEALNGNVSAGPFIDLTAGTMPSGIQGDYGYFPGYVGNIDLGQTGVIGGSVNATANGNITGLVISRQNANINAAQNFNGTVLAGDSANVTGGGTVSGTIVGVGGASVSGGSVTASVLGQNVSVNGGASQSTLGASASATSTSQAAAQQANSQAQQQVADNTSSTDDDKKKKKSPLLQHIKRVTVILPKST